MWKDKLNYNISNILLNNDNIQTYEDTKTSLYLSFYSAFLKNKDLVAIVDDDEKQYKYKDIYELTTKFSFFLMKNGIKKDDYVVLLMMSGVEYCISILALNKIGAIVVPISNKLKTQEINALIDGVDIKAFIYDDELKTIPKHNNAIYINKNDIYSCKDFIEIEPNTDPSDDCLMMFSSGTTGKSKGIILSNINVSHAINTYIKIFALNNKSNVLLSVPMCYITGLVAIFGASICSGAKLYIHKIFNAQRIVKDLYDKDITYFHASPTVFILIEKESKLREAPNTKYFACGSSNMPVEKIKKIKKWAYKTEFRTIYGLSETSSPCTIFPHDATNDIHNKSSGLLVPGLKLKIVNENDEELPNNQIGEIVLKGTCVLKKYFNKDKEAYKDGWFHTMDLGYVDDDGYLYVLDRIKDMINRGGEKIYSYEIENEILKMENIEDVAIIGVNDDIYGEVPVVAIVSKRNKTVTLEDIKQFLNDKVAKYKIPVQIMYFDKLPISQNNKVDKKYIKQLFDERKELI